MVLPVGNQDVAGLVKGDAPGLVELALAFPGTAALADKLAFRGENLQTAVAAVDDDHIAAFFDRETRWAIELAVTAAGRAPFADELAVAVKHGDRVGPFIRYVNLPLVVDGNTERPDAVSVAVAVFAKVGDPIFFARAAELHFVAVHPEVVFAAAVGGIEDATFVQGHGLDVIEPVASGRTAPDRMTPIKDSSARNRCQRHSLLLCCWAIGHWQCLRPLDLSCVTSVAPPTPAPSAGAKAEQSSPMIGASSGATGSPGNHCSREPSYRLADGCAGARQ